MHEELIKKTRKHSMESLSCSSGTDTVFFKKMIKIIICPCHREQTEVREQDQIVKEIHSHCNVENETFVVTFPGHMTIYPLLDNMTKMLW